MMSTPAAVERDWNVMDTFIRSCACEGRRPPGVHPARCLPRYGLMAKMMQDRGAVRYITAPSRYGKSCAAFGYAEGIFRLKNVFWIPAGDPRFLRDLDQGDFADYLLASSTRPSLLVLDDLPHLELERSERLSTALEILLSRGWETVVTTLPSRDNTGSLDVPVMKLGVKDLLLDEDEQAERASLSFDGHAAASRIPGLAWAPPEERRAFLSHVLEEDLPSEIQFAHLTMLVLGYGDLSDVARLQGREIDNVLAILSEQHPYLCIDRDAGTFKVDGIPEATALDAVRPRMDRAVRAMRGATVDEWASKMADLLMGHGRDARACDVVRMLCACPTRESWLERRQRRLSFDGCLLPAQRLAESVVRVRARTRDTVRAETAWRLLALGENDHARAEARAVMEDFEAGDDARLSASVLLAHSPADRAQALPLVVRFAHCSAVDAAGGLPSAERSCRQAVALWRDGRASEEDAHRACARWAALAFAASDDGTLKALMTAKEQAEAAQGMEGPADWSLSSTLLAIAFDAAARLRKAGGLSKDAKRAVQDLRSLAAQAIVRASHSDRPDACTLRLVDKSALSVSTLLRSGADASYLERLRELEEDITAQRETRAEEQSRRPRERPGSARAAAPSVPQLRLKFFGGMEAYVGARLVDPALFRRQKVQTLATLLAIARGREVGIDHLVDTLWPSSTASRARNNFYSTWSLLKRALEVTPKDCPYLVRLQNSCRMEASLVTTDVDEFLSLCDKLQFSTPDSALLPAMFSRLDELYSGDLLPSERENPSIVAYRSELKARLVDALLAASARAHDASESVVAVQAARTALRHDEGREDAYDALMRAQTAAGQRSGAMETFFQCRRYLNESLGIDPSQRTSALYQRLLDEEAPAGEQLRLPI